MRRGDKRRLIQLHQRRAGRDVLAERDIHANDARGTRTPERGDVAGTSGDDSDGTHRLDERLLCRNGGAHGHHGGDRVAFLAVMRTAGKGQRGDERNVRPHRASPGASEITRSSAAKIHALARSSMYCASTSLALRCASRTFGSDAAPSRYAVMDIEATRDAAVTSCWSRATVASAIVSSRRARAISARLCTCANPSSAWARACSARACMIAPRLRLKSGIGNATPKVGRSPGWSGSPLSMPALRLGAAKMLRCC